MPQTGQVRHGQVHPDPVVDPDAVDGRRPYGPGQHDDRLPAGELGQPGGGGARAEQDQRLAAVVLQGGDGPGLGATGGDAGQSDRVAGRFGGRIDALDQVAVKGLRHFKAHPDQA